MEYGDKVLLKEYKNGNKLWGIVSHCPKCQDTGKVIWSFADHVCFDCDGKGWFYTKETEYTPENLAKHQAKLAKKEAEAAKLREEREAERAEREAAWKAEQAVFEAKRRGHYFGEIGQKVEVEVTYMGFGRFDTFYGTTYIYKFDTDDGAHLVWKTGTELGGLERQILEGDRLKIKASIKDHKDYHGIYQTELQRVKVLDGGVVRRILTAEELTEGDKLAHDYGGSSDEYQLWLREIYKK